jgi:hypothetical protein
VGGRWEVCVCVCGGGGGRKYLSEGSLEGGNRGNPRREACGELVSMLFA